MKPSESDLKEAIDVARDMLAERKADFARELDYLLTMLQDAAITCRSGRKTRTLKLLSECLTAEYDVTGECEVTTLVANRLGLEDALDEFDAQSF